MTLENTHFGSEYGIESRIPSVYDWSLTGVPGIGYETYKEAYQEALKLSASVSTFVQKTKKVISKSNLDNVEFRIVVYDYDGSERKNIRVLTVV